MPGRTRKVQLSCWSELRGPFQIIAQALNPDRKAVYQLASHLGAAQPDLAFLQAGNIEWEEKLKPNQFSSSRLLIQADDSGHSVRSATRAALPRVVLPSRVLDSLSAMSFSALITSINW